MKYPITRKDKDDPGSEDASSADQDKIDIHHIASYNASTERTMLAD